MRSTVLGAGSWGTALASVLASKGFPVTLWGRDAAVLDAVARKHENPHYLPGVKLPPSLGASASLSRALEGAELVVFAVPSAGMRQVAIEAKRHLHAGTAAVSAAKGIEEGSLMSMAEVLEDVLPVAMHPYLAYIGGPSFASEVVQQMPTAITVAGRWDRVTKSVQDAFHTRWFRPYTSNDVPGNELGGVVKNVIAIAAGMSDGLGYGANARAALITRGLAEVTRLAVRKGANPLTLAGLSGVGDLVLTCSSDLSRNRRVGFGLGKGRTLVEVQTELGQVAEGVVAARTVRELSHRLHVEMPITEVVYRVLHQDLSPKQAVVDLMTRETKAEI
jgi:glycerol-3-phosphate dehydrogenase (NAD(P)+)